MSTILGLLPGYAYHPEAGTPAPREPRLGLSATTRVDEGRADCAMATAIDALMSALSNSCVCAEHPGVPVGDFCPVHGVSLDLPACNEGVLKP